MNIQTALGKTNLGTFDQPMSALKNWRKRQMVDDGNGGKRTMRITDVPDAFGVPVSTWHQWEQMPGDQEFRCPNAANMQRICREITKGEVTPGDFYPPIGTT